MTLPDLMWIHAKHMQARAEEDARRREQRRQLPPAERHLVPADWLGAGFIFFGDRMHAFGERLCPTCPCPDLSTGSGSSR